MAGVGGIVQIVGMHGMFGNQNNFGYRTFGASLLDSDPFDGLLVLILL